MNTIKTLIVDDEEMIRNGIARLIRNYGEEWEVTATFSDGKEALDYLCQSNDNIDLLITDVRMPEMDGLTLISEARRMQSFFSLVVSGYDDFQYVQTALREGAVDYILKPIDREQFKERIIEIRTKIEIERSEMMKWTAMEQNSEKLKYTRQIQWLSYVTSAGLDMSRLYGVDIFPEGMYSLLYVSLDIQAEQHISYTAKDWAAFLYAIENIITELAEQSAYEHEGCGWCWRGSDSDFWVLLQLPKKPISNRDRAEHIVQALKDKISLAIPTYTPFTVSAAYGDVMDHLHSLPEAKEQAETRLKFYAKNIGMEAIEQAKLLIKHHLHENLTIKWIADQVYLNPSYFSRIFKMQTEETVLNYVTGLRMSKAKELLGNPKLKLYDICCQIGYQDVKYCSRLFKQWVGVTPSEYREQLY